MPGLPGCNAMRRHPPWSTTEATECRLSDAGVDSPCGRGCTACHSNRGRPAGRRAGPVPDRAARFVRVTQDHPGLGQRSRPWEAGSEHLSAGDRRRGCRLPICHVTQSKPIRPITSPLSPLLHVLAGGYTGNEKRPQGSEPRVKCPECPTVIRTAPISRGCRPMTCPRRVVPPLLLRPHAARTTPAGSWSS